MAIKFPESIKTAEQFEQIRDAMESSHAGSTNAWKTLYLAAGADVTVVGADFKTIDFKSIQGTYETRICNAARVPAVVAGVSEGLSGSSLNAGNFSQARRLFVDGWYRPHVRSLCSALSKLVRVPAGAELWYDDTDIGMLREDLKDSAEISGKQMSAIRQSIEAGFDPDAAVQAVMANDLSKLLGSHSGLTSVQLLPPDQGGQKDSASDGASTDGSASNGSDPYTESTDSRMSVADLTVALQKIYLAVGKVITAEEARSILNRAGAGLAEVLPDDLPNVPVLLAGNPGGSNQAGNQEAP